MSMLEVQAVGNVGKAAEMQYREDGTPVVKFSVAHNPYAKQGAEKPETIWLRCYWQGDRAANVAEYLTAGKTVFVRGDLTPSMWTDDNGVTRLSLNVRVSALQFASNRTDEQGHAAPTRAPAAATKPAQRPQQTAIDEEDIPF